jgi:hypothetical protein
MNLENISVTDQLLYCLVYVDVIQTRGHIVCVRACSRARRSHNIKDITWNCNERTSLPYTSIRPMKNRSVIVFSLLEGLHYRHIALTDFCFFHGQVSFEVCDMKIISNSIHCIPCHSFSIQSYKAFLVIQY